MNVTAWLLVASCAIACWTLIARVGLNLSLTSVALVFLIVFHGPAYLYYTRTYGPDTDFYEIIVAAARGQDVIGPLDIALALTFLMMCLGIVLADLTMRVGRRRWRRAILDWKTSAPRYSAWEVERLRTACVVIMVTLLMPFLFIDGQIPKTLNYFTADLGEFEKIALRREGGGSSFYLYNLLLSNVMPFIAFCLIGLLYVRARFSKGLAIAFIALVAFGKAATLSKAPLAIYVLQCVSVWLLLRRLTLSLGATAVFMLLATGLFILMSWVANPSADELNLILAFLFYRIFMIVNESLVEYFAAIPYVIEHSWGSAAGWIAALSDQEPRLPTYWLVGEVHRGAIGSTTTAMFMGDAWADYAWAGVVVVSLAIGALVRWIDIQLIVRRGKTVVAVAGLAMGHYGLFIAMSTSFQTALITGGLAFVLPVVYFLSRRPAHRRSKTPVGRPSAHAAASAASS